MKKLISLTFVLLLVVWQCNLCSAGPGFVTIDAPQEPWKSRATVNKSSISTKLPTSLGDQKIVVATVTPSSPPTSSPSFSSFNPIKLSHEDVIKGSNSVYGSQSLTNGGIIFAFAGHHNSAPSSSSQLMSTAPPQPVLMQYLSSQGVPQSAAVQYIQLLRPIMMVPAQPYVPMGSTSETKSTTVSPPTSPIYKQHSMNPYGPYFRNNNNLIGAYSSPMSSYLQVNGNLRPMDRPTSFDLGLNMNEYMPSASSRVSAVVMPGAAYNKFQTRAQRA